MRMDTTAGFAKSSRAARWEWPDLVAEEARISLRVRLEKVLKLPTAAGEAASAVPRPDPDSDGET